MPNLVRPDVTLHYEIGGSGPVLLLLAGMLSDSASWGPLVAPLEERFTVVRPDNRTTGRTHPWDAPVTLGAMADDAVALMAHLGAERYHVAGHSMGGILGIEVAGRDPGGAASLSIMASAPLRIPRTMAMFDTLMAIRAAPGGEALWLRALYPWAFRPAFFEDPANIEVALGAALNYPHAQGLDAMALQVAALKGYQRETALADLALPVQVIYGEHDLMIPEAPARAAFAAIPGVEQRTIADAGHSLHWDQPQAVLAALTGFLDRL